jgi:hypothetical protein
LDHEKVDGIPVFEEDNIRSETGGKENERINDSGSM